MKILYNAVAIPIVTYGAALWYDKVSHTHTKRNLDAAQRTLLVTLTKACKTTTCALQTISGMMPLDLAIIRQGIINKIKRNEAVTWKGYSYQSREDWNSICSGEVQHRMKHAFSVTRKKRWTT